MNIAEIQLSPVQPVAEVKVKMTGGNVGIATVIQEIYDPFREPLQAGDKLYTAPPQRPWVGLTDEEIAQGNKESWVTEQAWQSAVWWAEAKLKEKNNG